MEIKLIKFLKFLCRLSIEIQILILYVNNNIVRLYEFIPKKINNNNKKVLERIIIISFIQKQIPAKNNFNFKKNSVKK